MDQHPHLLEAGAPGEGIVVCFEVLSMAGEIGGSGNGSKHKEEEEGEGEE